MASDNELFNQREFEGLNQHLTTVILCLVVVLVCDTFCKSRSTATILVFFMSFVITSVAALCFGKKDGALARLDLIFNNPRFVEFLLVPPIIFDCAVNFDPQDFKKFRWQILLFVGPIFVLSALFYGCMVFACSFSAFDDETMKNMLMVDVFRHSGFMTAIDPITVGALVDDLGISYQLSTIIKLESLLAQASAFIFQAAVAVSFDPAVVSMLIIDLAGVAACLALGYIYGRATGSFLANVFYVDHVAEGGIILVMVFVSYGTGAVLQSSGALCTCVFAITFNSCRNVIGQRTYDDMRQFWGTVAFCAHGILIALVGATAGFDYMNDALIYRRRLELIALFPLTVLARFVSILTFTPLLRYFGGFEIEYVAMSVVAGLRGFLPILMVARYIYDIEEGIDVDDPSEEELRRHNSYKMSYQAYIVVIVASQLIQGLSASPLAKWLGLRASTRSQADHLRTFADRANAQLPERINYRKQMPEFAMAEWRLIEKEIVFDFTTTTDGDGGKGKRKGRKSKKKAKQKQQLRTETSEEIEARERVQHCYEIQVRKLWRSQGASIASRALENAIGEAAINRRAIDVQNLFDDLQPNPIWRRLAIRGQKLVNLFKLKRVFDYLSVYRTFWRWRVLVCIVSMAASLCQLYGFIQSINKPFVAPMFFWTTAVLFGLTVEQAVRLYFLIQRHRRSFRWLELTTTFYFWFETCLLLFQLFAVAALYVGIVWLKCVDKNGLDGYVDFATKIECGRWRVAMIVAASLPLIQWPLILVSIFRLTSYEIETYVQNCDEDTFEAFNGLLVVGDTILRLLAGQSLVKNNAVLKKKLSEECLATKFAVEDKLIELLNRQGGVATLAAIKTRQAAREVTEEVGQLLSEARAKGVFRDFEYLCMNYILNQMRADAQSLHKKKSRAAADRDNQDQSEDGALTNEAALAMLVDQLKQMEWIRKSGSREISARVIDQLKSAGRVERLKKWTIIFGEGDKPKEPGVYILLNGFCRGAKYETSSEEIELRLIYAGTLFGETALVNELYSETVTVASPTVSTFWFGSKIIQNFPEHVQEAFQIFVMKKAGAQYLRNDKRFHAWSDEMLHQYVRKSMKSTNPGDEVPVEYRKLVLFKGTFVDANNKEYRGNPYRPMKISIRGKRSFDGPLTVHPQGGVAYYMINRTDIEDDEECAEEESFLNMDLDSVGSAGSRSPGSLLKEPIGKAFVSPSQLKTKKKQ